MLLTGIVQTNYSNAFSINFCHNVKYFKDGAPWWCENDIFLINFVCYISCDTLGLEKLGPCEWGFTMERAKSILSFNVHIFSHIADIDV